jgi:hypothetical protein
VEPPTISLPLLEADGTLSLKIFAEVGEELVLETTTDLTLWTEEQTMSGQGRNQPVLVIVEPDTQTDARFWRVRIR